MANSLPMQLKHGDIVYTTHRAPAYSALVHGIVPVRVILNAGDTVMARWKSETQTAIFWEEGIDWHRTLEQEQQYFSHLAVNRRKELKNQIQKLNEFETKMLSPNCLDANVDWLKSAPSSILEAERESVAQWRQEP